MYEPIKGLVLEEQKLTDIFQDLIGRIILSSRSDPASVAHWNAMLQYPKEAVSQWHTLKDD
jgi:hypothetical protein